MYYGCLNDEATQSRVGNAFQTRLLMKEHIINGISKRVNVEPWRSTRLGVSSRSVGATLSVHDPLSFLLSCRTPCEVLLLNMNISSSPLAVVPNTGPEKRAVYLPEYSKIRIKTKQRLRE